MASFWASPAEVLRRFEAGEVQLMPPTHRTIALLAGCATTDAVLAMAEASCLDPICPRLVPARRTTPARRWRSCCPATRSTTVREERVPGGSRYVLRGDRWLAEDPPR